MGEEFSPIKMERDAVNISTVLQKVFVLMTVGLVVTGVTSLVVVSNLAFLEFMLNTFYLWAIAELVIVIFMSARIEKIGSGTRNDCIYIICDCKWFDFINNIFGIHI